jgi:hypothetical protein
LNVDEDVLKIMYNKKQNTQDPVYNWKVISDELVKIGLFLTPEQIEACSEKSVEGVSLVFRRIDRFIKMITFGEEDILSFKDYRININVRSHQKVVHSLLNNIVFKNKGGDSSLSPNHQRRGGAPKQFLKRSSIYVGNSGIVTN